MSLKAYEPSLLIHLVHDSKAIKHLNDAERSLFDSFSDADPADYMIDGKPQYQRMKLCAHKYSPFEETLYIDVDTLWFPKKPISGLISHLRAHNFFIGKNAEFNPTAKNKPNNYTYWYKDPLQICKYFKLTNPMPQTISGVFWFKKSAFCDRLFVRCLEIYNDKAAPCRQWANGKPDEYCFNVALSELGYQQKNTHLVYFDKVNGVISREQMCNNFWGLAAGGNQLIDVVRSFYNDLVKAYSKVFNTGITRFHVDKMAVIRERRNF